MISSSLNSIIELEFFLSSKISTPNYPHHPPRLIILLYFKIPRYHIKHNNYTIKNILVRKKNNIKIYLYFKVLPTPSFPKRYFICEMSLTAQIGSSDSSFKLSQKLVASLAEKFGFKFEDGWSTVSNRTVDNVQKRLKRERRRANPASQVKHPRTAFSFFTQQQRPIEAGKHKEATFGQLSRFVSDAWKALTPAQLQTYKDMEAKDKTRYQTERAAALAAAPAQAAPVDAAPAEVAAASTDAKPKKERKAKATAAPAAAATPADAKPSKAPKVAKVPKAVAATAAPAVAAAETKPAKAAKAPKAPKAAKAETPVAAPVAAAVTPAPATATKAAKAPKAAKTAGKA